MLSIYILLNFSCALYTTNKFKINAYLRGFMIKLGGFNFLNPAKDVLYLIQLLLLSFFFPYLLNPLAGKGNLNPDAVAVTGTGMGVAVACTRGTCPGTT